MHYSHSLPLKFVVTTNKSMYCGISKTLASHASTQISTIWLTHRDCDWSTQHCVMRERESKICFCRSFLHLNRGVNYLILSLRFRNPYFLHHFYHHTTFIHRISAYIRFYLTVNILTKSRWHLSVLLSRNRFKY